MLAGTIPAAQLAVDRINNNSSILPNHYLQLATANDSMVSFLPLNSRWACLNFFPSHLSAMQMVLLMSTSGSGQTICETKLLPFSLEQGVPLPQSPC